ncbi:hypothetical protein LP414_24005 [Polaromonas sp. P1(28)-13]|nr:hypothetical protein LP417_05875 [Polaromonas sp. P1-6]UUZ75068.1 hypothetical protein LP414_24005 [Polaromonas sp. P1(28)-13]
MATLEWGISPQGIAPASRPNASVWSALAVPGDQLLDLETTSLFNLSQK